MSTESTSRQFDDSNHAEDELPEQNETAEVTSGEHQENEGFEEKQASEEDTNVLTVNLTASLIRKINLKAQQEGVTVNDLVSELLAEGVVLRAWEIMERKSAMKTGQSQNSNYNSNSNRSSNRSNQRSSQGGRGRASGNSGGGRRNNNKFKNIMDDNASFIEYVRSQEKKGRRD